MCGIHVVVSASPIGDIPTDVHRRLCNRGPDHLATHATSLGDVHVALTSTVLALRGDHIARQPFVDEQTGSVFCWNGEAWKIRHADVSGNDGEAIANLLHAACQCAPTERQDAIMKVLRSIDGPFAFVFFDKPSRMLYFGRDRLGRRSLVFRSDGNGLVLSSVADSKDPQWIEVEADGIYSLSLAVPVSELADNKLMAPVFSKLAWLEGDDVAEVVSEQLQWAFHAMRHSEDHYHELTDQDLLYWHFQHDHSKSEGIAVSDADGSRGSSPAVDRVAKIASSQCTKPSYYRWTAGQDQGGNSLFWRFGLYCPRTIVSWNSAL